MINKVTLFIFLVYSVSTSKILIPMDLTQTDHLMAYGVAYQVLADNVNVEWLLNFRGGSFLISEDSKLIKLCQVRGIRFELISAGQEIDIRKIIEKENMDALLLEKVPKIAVYVPSNTEPWDDAVRLALDYAKIPYDCLWDKEVLSGKLTKYDWLHLHHEDFTGQYGKFATQYYNTMWYQQEVAFPFYFSDAAVGRPFKIACGRAFHRSLKLRAQSNFCRQDWMVGIGDILTKSPQMF